MIEYKSVLLSVCILLVCSLSSTEARRNVTGNDSTNDLFSSESLPNPRIIGGNNAQIGRYPYMVSLLSRSGFHQCGGILVAKDMVLTAAHCIGSLGRAHVGRYSKLQVTNDVFDNLRIIKTFVHPQYVGQVQGNYDREDDGLDFDFALLKLEGPSNNTPVLMNSKFFIPGQNHVLTAIGFGQTIPDDSSSQAPILQEVDLSYIPSDQCDRSTNGVQSYEGLITDEMLCAAGDGKDACFGDSGGPLVIKRENGINAEERAQDIVVGITSWGYGCADPGLPGVYSRISDQYGWLTEMICEKSETPPPAYNCPVYGDDGDVAVVFRLTLDNNPSETSWIISCGDNVVYGQGSLGEYGDKPLKTVEQLVFVPGGSNCQLTVEDEFGDGLCCDKAGSYQLTLFSDPSQVYASGGGNFGAEAVYEFVPPVNGGGIPDDVIGDGTIPLTVNIQFDQFPEEIGWQVDRIGLDTQTVFNFPPGSYREKGVWVAKTVMLEDNQIYTWRIVDSEGDGMPDGRFQVLLGTTDVTDRTKSIVERRGVDLADSLETTFKSWDNNGPTSAPLFEDGDKFITIQFGLDTNPEEIGAQLRIRNRSVSDISRADDGNGDGEILWYLDIGHYAGSKRSLVTEQILVPPLVPNTERDFIFVITDSGGDGLCCDWASQAVPPGFSIYEGTPSDENLILTSRMRETGREIKYFSLLSEQKYPVPTDPPTVETLSEMVNIEVSLRFRDSSRSGTSRYYIEDISSKNRVVNYRCAPNAASTRTYSIPEGVYQLVVEENCDNVQRALSFPMEYTVRLPDEGRNRPALLHGSEAGRYTFIAQGNDLSSVPMGLEFTTGTDPSLLSYYVKRLDVIEADAFVAQVPQHFLAPDSFYSQSISLQGGGLYQIALKGATQTSLVSNRAKLTLSDNLFQVEFPGEEQSENKFYKYLAGSLPPVSLNGPFLSLRINYDGFPLELEYVLLEVTEDVGPLASARSISTLSSTMLKNQKVIAFGPQDDALVATKANQQHVEVLRLPSYSGEKKFTLIISDSGGNGLCCREGEGGPVTLFEGSVSDGRVLFEDGFQGTGRLVFTFTRQGDIKSSGTGPGFSFFYGLVSLYMTFVLSQ